MTRYHMSKDGVSRECEADVGGCPIKDENGDTAPHGDFTSKEEADAWAEKNLQDNYGLIRSNKKNSKIGTLVNDITPESDGSYSIPAGEYFAVNSEDVADSESYRIFEKSFEELGEFGAGSIDGEPIYVDNESSSGVVNGLVSAALFEQMKKTGVIFNSPEKVILSDSLRVSKANDDDESESYLTPSVEGTTTFLNILMSPKDPMKQAEFDED